MAIAEKLKNLFRLPDGPDEEARQRSRVFMLTWMVAVTGLTLFLLYFAFLGHSLNLVPMTLLELATFFSFWAYRKRHPDLGANTLVWSFLAGVFSLAYINDGLRDSAFQVFPAILIAAALLIVKRQLLGISVCSFLAFALLGFLRLDRPDKAPASDALPIFELIELLAIHGATILLVFLISSYLKGSLSRARQGEAQLYASELRYRELFNKARLAIFQIMADGEIITVNPDFARMFGYRSPEELIAAVGNSNQLYAERGRREEILRRLSENPDQNVFEVLFRRKDGDTILGKLHIHRIEHPDGRLQCYQGFIEDITERRRAEDALQASEARFRALIENSYDGTLLLDGERNIIFASPSYERLLGYAPEEMVGRKSFGFVHPADAEKNNQPFRELLRNPGGTALVQYRAKHRDGSWRWLETTAVNLLSNPAVRAFVANSRDISERKTAESALLESQALINAIVNSTSDMIWSVDAERFGLTSFNEGLSEYFQRKRGIAIKLGDTPEILLPTAETAGIWRGFYARALEEGPYATDYVVSAGTNVLRLNFNLLRNGGQAYGISVFGQDITENRRAEEQIRKSLTEKETLLRELYHRTQNNMSVIMSLLEMQSDLTADARLTEAFTDAQNRIRSMALVHQKLYGAQDLSFVDMKEYITDLASLLSDSYDPPAKRVAAILELEQVSILIDSAIPCALVLNELITNAYKHAFPDGRHGQLRISLNRNAEGLVRLEVVDNGIGVPPAFDFRRTGRLGLQNAVSLVQEQLRGRLGLDASAGMAWSIEFRDDQYRPRV